MVGATGIEPVKPLSRQESALPTELSTQNITSLLYLRAKVHDYFALPASPSQSNQKR